MDNSQVFVVVQANQLGQKLVSLFVAEMKLDEVRGCGQCASCT